MATDADFSDFKTTLVKALTDTKGFEVLVVHPEFRNRLARICRPIAQPDDAAELVQEICARLRKHVVASELPNFTNQRQFFAWLTILANNAHLSKRRQRIESMTCTDKTKHWPRSSSEVSIDLADEYMDHAEECAYHKELMLLEQKETEQELRLAFRRARGLDSEGRLLRGTMLAATIADHERRLASWKKGEGETNSPFQHIGLYNGGKEIASCGRFLDFSRHESVNELEPQAGLQIRGINSVEDQDVLLGFYALVGVRHDGEEQLLPLDNGYTVGLRVVRLKERTFAIDFRCVETEMMEELSYRKDYANKNGKLPRWFADLAMSLLASAMKASKLGPPRKHPFMAICKTSPLPPSAWTRLRSRCSAGSLRRCTKIDLHALDWHARPKLTRKNSSSMVTSPTNPEMEK